MPGTFKIDFSSVPDNNIPPGEYEAVINKVEFKEGPKAPYLNWEFEVLEGDYEGRRVWSNTSLSQNALFRLKAFADGLGLEHGFDLEYDEETGLVYNPDLEGAEVTIKTSTSKYLGQERPQVDAILDYHTTTHLGEVIPGELAEEEAEFDEDPVAEELLQQFAVVEEDFEDEDEEEEEESDEFESL